MNAYLLVALALPAPPSAAPLLSGPAFPGGQPGEVVTLTLVGTRLDGPTAIFLDTNEVNASFTRKTAESCTVQFTVPGDLVTGLHTLRIATKKGVSNLKPFLVDALPAERGGGKRTNKSTPQALAGPRVVIAATTADASDFYIFKVKNGQRVAVEAVGRRMGSAVDPVLILHDAAGGRELPGLYADDTLGLQADARVAFTAERDFDLLIEIRDTTFRGGLDYRLRVGDCPGVAATFPLAVQKVPSSVGFVSAEQVPGQEISTVPQLLSPLAGWGVSVRPSDVPTSVEREPNDDVKSAPALSIPCGVSAKFDRKNDRDVFAVTLKKGEAITAVADAARFALPTEVDLILQTASGEVKTRSDPMKPAAAIEYEAGADGTYFLVAEHLNFGWGPLEAYHLEVRPRVPAAVASLGAETVIVPGRLNVVELQRLHGYEGEVKFRWLGDAAIQVNGAIPAKETPKPDASFPLTFTAKPGTKPGVYFGRVVAMAGKQERPVSTLPAIRPLFNNLEVLPATLDGVIAVGVP